MKEKPNVEKLISASMSSLMDRAQRLPEKEKMAITQEFREWLSGDCKLEDLLILDTRIK